MTENDTAIVLVTGANTGIGLHAARQLARAGAHVLLGARDPSRGAAAAAELATEGLDVEHVTLDVTDDDTIGAVARHVTDTHGRLDVLVNNAAIVGDGFPPSRASRPSMLRTFDTNVVGIIALTNALLPLLRQSRRPRIVNVSSELGNSRLVSDPDWAYASVNSVAYQASKAALDMVTVLYAKELAAERIPVISASPGYRATGLSGQPTPGAGDPAEGAAAIVALALADDLPTGRFFSDQGEQVAW